MSCATILNNPSIRKIPTNALISVIMLLLYRTGADIIYYNGLRLFEIQEKGVIQMYSLENCSLLKRGGGGGEMCDRCYVYWQISNVIAAKYRAKHGYRDQKEWARRSHSFTPSPSTPDSRDQYEGELHQAKLICGGGGRAVHICASQWSVSTRSKTKCPQWLDDCGNWSVGGRGGWWSAND